MLRRDGSSFVVRRRGGKVRRLVFLFLPLIAGLFLLGARPGFVQTSPLGSGPTASPMGSGTASNTPSCSSESSSSSNSTFDGGGMTGLSGMSAMSEVSTSGISGVSNACSTPSTGISSSNDASGIAGGNSALGEMQLGSNGTANPTRLTFSTSSADIVPSAPCIGADSAAGISVSVRGTGSTGRTPGSIAGMGGTGEITDSVTVTSGDGISGSLTTCTDGPFGAMHLNPTTPASPTSSGTNLSASSGME
jgi:hypothetical protein